MRRLEQAALKIHLIPLCTFQGETVHCYFAFTNLWVCLQISPNIFVHLRKYIYVKTYSCWWIWIFGWMAGNIILMDLCKYLAGRWNTSCSGASTENSKSTWIWIFPNAAIQPPSHLVDAAVVRPGEVLPDGGDEGVVVEEARQPERGGKAGLQNKTGWTSTKTSGLSQARLNIKSMVLNHYSKDIDIDI